MSEKVCIVYSDILTVYGHGVSCCMKGLFENRTGFAQVTRFQSNAPEPAVAACFPEEILPGAGDCLAGASLVFLLEKMMEKISFRGEMPTFFFALTQGEISKLDNPEKLWTAQVLVRELAGYYPVNNRSRIFSASCASGNIALARASAEIERGFPGPILVAGCDVVSEFTYAGFSSVHAVTPGVCRPYDISHDGLLLGDAAGVILLASEKTAQKNGWPILALLDGYGITTDSYHAAAPDPEGVQMALAIEKVLLRDPGRRVAGIIGHGTGPALNDDMEIAALAKVFPHGVPLASVKGGTGHILAASGIVQAACAAGCLERGMMFPQTSLQTPQKGAEKFVSAKEQALQGDWILTLNAGFGGLNAAIGIRRY